MDNERELLKQANKIRAMLGDWNSLLKLKHEIISLDPKCDEIYYIAAQYLTDNKDYFLAEKHVKKAISLNNKKQEYFDLYTKILMKWIDICIRDDEKAGWNFKKQRDKDLKKVIQQSIKLKPTVLNYMNLGDYYFSNKNNKKAIEAYSKCIEIDKTDAYLYEIRASIKKDLKDYEGALFDYKKVLELMPENPDFGIYYDISEIYKILDNLEKALEYLNLAIEKCPQDLMKYYTMYSDKARLLYDLGKFDEALEAQLKHDKCSLNNFEHIDSYLTTGRYYELAKQYKQALKYYNKAIKNNEGFWAYLYKASMFLNIGKYSKKVIKLYDYAQSLNLPKDLLYGVYYERGLAYYYLKDFKNALENFKLATKANPKHIDSILMKYYTEFQLGKIKSAIKSIEKLNEKRPDDPVYIGYLLAAYYCQKRYPVIIDLCDNLLTKHSKRSMLYLFKALAFRELGDDEKFEINIKKAYELANDDNEESIIKAFYNIYNIKLSPLKVK